MNPPYTFTDLYEFCYVVPNQAMDPRHVFILHDVLSGWPFKSALELGSFCGASSTAFVEAINAGSEMVATFCDIQLSESLSNVLLNCRDQDRVRATQCLTVQVLGSTDEFDFILVDASHDLKSVSQELARIIPRKPLCVMAHDTSATDNGFPLSEGAQLLKRTFQARADYYCIEDAKYRDGEQTHRGLFLATTDQRLFSVACRAFEKWA